MLIGRCNFAGLSLFSLGLGLTMGCAATSSGQAVSGRPVPDPIYVFTPPPAHELDAIRYPNLRLELLDMVKRDQQARMGLYADAGDPSKDAISAMTHVDREHTERMHEIVDEVGWPTISMVGSDGTQAAWLLVQHADLDPAFQRRCLSLMEALRGRGEIYAQNLAYLTDRVLVNEGKKQEYGTQFHVVDGKQQPRPIRDANNVDKRRAALGLSTLAGYIKLMKT